jgi:equilibrative nucleoside transporter 1/2/3
MFLAAAPYFFHRFESNKWIARHFQSAEISVSTVANLGSMLVLTKLQKHASYPRRIATSLLINIVVFALLAVSTLINTSAGTYFGFLMVAVLLASLSTGLIQNGLFAFTSGFGRSEYTQAIMTGQAIAGVCPPLAQIVSVYVIKQPKRGDTPAPTESPKSAFIYFLTATIVSSVALLAFFYLLRRQAQIAYPNSTLSSAAKPTANGTPEGNAITNDATTTPNARRRSLGGDHTSIPLGTLFKRMPFLATAVFICFAVTMIFPVFTANITSIHNTTPAIFIPLAFLCWNVGDLVGRLLTLSPRVSLTYWPFALFCIAMARLVFVPLYFLCNVGGRGAVVQSDVFYLLVVQGLFGLTNGYLGSDCLRGSGEWVKEEEREAAGGFMGLCLVAGLTVGSLLSFLLGSKV